jgi:CHAT domain-containing protein
VALTGANLPLDQGGTEGLLFAAEVQEMGLEGTELAVMSLCQGGAGESFPGEGLYGLNRALSLAGVASRLTALWTVPDAATCILMQRFYQNLIVQRMGRLEALEEAQRLVRTLSREEWEELYRTSRWPELVKDTRRNESKERPFALPIFWAGFVLHGERGPLRGEIGRGGA